MNLWATWTDRMFSMQDVRTEWLDLVYASHPRHPRTLPQLPNPSRWGDADAEIGFPSTGNPEPSGFLVFGPSVGQSVSRRVSWPAAKKSVLFLHLSVFLHLTLSLPAPADTFF